MGDGNWRLFYTAVGPAKPYPSCQGYILSAVSDDGLVFRTERGIRLAPHPDVSHMCLRLVSPTVTVCAGGGWRMYFESRGTADQPAVICSAISSDMLHWEHEDAIRLQGFEGIGGPRYLSLPDGRGRLYCVGRKADSIVSAVTTDGLNFELEPGIRMCSRQGEYDSMGITAAEVVAPVDEGGNWTMFFSAWQDVPPGTIVPLHPSLDVNSVANGQSENFAAASILSDMAGYRSRIFVAYSIDGLVWERGPCVIEGAGHGQAGLDAVHAEDMSVIRIGGGKYRMYYAACDKDGNWRIASGVTTECVP